MLPHQINEILKSNKLCCLGTHDGDEPYLSLMFFTLVESEGILVMSSRTGSAKIMNLVQHPQAAVLVHQGADPAHQVAVSLSGTVELLVGSEAEKYRRAYQNAHPLQTPFSSGEELTMIIFRPRKAVISDQQDNVTYWQD